MKILHLITGLGSGGAEHMLKRLVGSMDAHEHCVVSMLPPGPVGDELLSMGVRVASLNMSRGVPSPAAIWKLRQTILHFNPDILQTWLYHADLLGTLCGALCRINRWKGRLVWNIRCSYMDFSMYSPLTAWTVKACAKMSSVPHGVITNSYAARTFHQEMGYKPERFEVLPNGFDTDLYKPDMKARAEIRKELGIAEDDFVIGMVARYDHMKGHSYFIKAASKLARNWIGPVKFILCGDGLDQSNQALMELLSRGAVTDSFILTGRRSDVSAIYNACDITTLSSLGEGFPNVLGESMLCEVPCVTTDVGDAAHMVDGIGVVVAPADADALLEGWKQMLQMDSTERQELGQRARKRIAEKYTLAVIAGKYEKFYEELLEK